MKIKVESISDAKGQESPSRFMLGIRTIEVEAVADRWYGEQACYFRVLGSDENSYILKGPLRRRLLGTSFLYAQRLARHRARIRGKTGASVTASLSAVTLF